MGWLDGYINKRKKNYQGMSDEELDTYLSDCVKEAIKEKRNLRQLALEGNLDKHVIWHGGCIRCVAQKKYPVNYCFDCRYFDTNWSLPDKSIKVVDETILPSPPVDRVKIKILKHRNENKTTKHFNDKDFEI